MSFRNRLFFLTYWPCITYHRIRYNGVVISGRYLVVKELRTSARSAGDSPALHAAGHLLAMTQAIGNAASSVRSSFEGSARSTRRRSALPAIATAPLVRFAIKADYRQALETINEFARIKF
jgi:hypothetical protein